MRAWALALALCACGPAVVAPKPVALASPSGHARTLEERRADVCKGTELVALEGPLVTSPNAAPIEDGVVRSVRVVGPAGNRVDAVAPAIAQLDAETVREGVRKLWRTGKFDDVVVETSRDGDGIDVVFHVTPKRDIANVFASADGDIDVASLGLAKGNVYDPVALVSAERSLRGALRKKGHLDASITVSSAFADADRRAIDVCVRVDRGPRVVLDKIEIRGSAYASALASKLASEDTTNVHGAVLDEDVLERDVLMLSAWLYDHGMVSSKIDKTIERHGSELAVILDVTDGPVYRYGAIDVKGDLVAPRAEYMKLVTAKRGDVFDRSQLIAVIDALRALNKSKGHDAVDVEPQTELDEKTHTVALSFSLKDKGKLSIVELAPGKGKAAANGDHVSVHYTGMLADGTVFDTSRQRAPFEFDLGGGMVIAGFEQGVMGMKVGGKRRVTIPPDKAYGSRGAPPKIPANAALVFEIELLAIR